MSLNYNIYTSYAVKVVNCSVHSMKSGEALAAPAVPALLMVLTMIIKHDMLQAIQGWIHGMAMGAV